MTIKVLRNIRMLCLICIMCQAAWQRSADAYPVAADHAVYAFLRRLAVKKTIPFPALGSLPLSRAEVVAALEASKAANLTDWEKARLAEYLRELDLAGRAETSRLGWADQDRMLVVSLHSRLGLYHRDSVPRADTYGFGTLGADIDGSFTRRLSFTAGAFIGSELSRHPRFKMNYDARRGLPYNTEQGRNIDPDDRDDMSTFDGYRVVFSYSRPGFRADAGYDWNQWGFGLWQHPSFSTSPWFWVKDPPSYDSSSGYTGDIFPGSYRRGYSYPGQGAPMLQARMVFSLGPFRYTKFVAEKTGLLRESSAHVSAHRLETTLPWGIRLGMYEMVVYSRPFEPTYALPLVPLFVAEHYLGDRDNIGLGLDANWLPLAGLRLYVDLFLDDLLNPAQLLGSYWGNKYAFSLGLETADIPVAGFSAGLEYARIEPWVFGHRITDSQMQHFGHLLGSSLPPNSHSLSARLSLAVSPSAIATVAYTFLQIDAVSRGGSIFHVHDPNSDGLTKTFLSGNPATRHRAFLGVRLFSPPFKVEPQIGWESSPAGAGPGGRGWNPVALALEVFFDY